MGWLLDLFKEQPFEEMEDSKNVSKKDQTDADFHIRRFELALEQCEKPFKRDELRLNLEYWKRVKELAEFSKGANV